MFIERDGQKIELTELEKIDAYREVLNDLAFEKAENHFKFFVFGDEDDEDEIFAISEDFRREYGMSYNELTNPASKLYIIPQIADAFLNRHEDNIADDEQFDVIINDLLHFYKWRLANEKK